jgi:hypothetical protein
MIFNLSFNYFTTEKKYLELQNKFESFNMPPRIGSEEDAIKKILKEDFSIVYLAADRVNGNSYKTLFFYRDFLNTQIANLGVNTIQEIEKRINNEFRFNEIERNSFIRITLNDFLLISQIIIEADYLLLDVQENLISQTNVVLEFLKDYDFGDTNNIIDKFQSKLQKNDLLLLLHLLRNKGILNHRIDSQFGHLVEKNFQYFEDKTNSYKNITKANKTINEIKNDHRPVEKAIKRLKEILQSDSFFDLNP